MNINKKKTIGLALGSGAYRGFAHIGVIKALEKNNISIDYLSGSSIGAWVAAHYAIFRDVAKLEADFIDKPTDNLPLLLDVGLAKGLISGRKFITYLEKSFGNYTFKDVRIPLKIVATDLATGQPFVFSSGSISSAVRASTSVPLVFKPFIYNEKMLVDGGLSDPVPGRLVKDMGAEIIIGVNLYHENEFKTGRLNMSKIALLSTRIALHNLATNDLRGVDVAIEPDCSVFVKKSVFNKYFTTAAGQEMIKIGELATERALPAIKKLLQI